MKREQWIDSCRFLAMFEIMCMHYLATFLPDVLVYWEIMPEQLLLNVFRGKLYFSLFFVLLGYFASAPRRFNGRDFIKYFFRRYELFVFFVFVTECCFLIGSYGVTWVFHMAEGDVLRVISDGPHYNLIYLLRDSFLLEYNYVDSFWCIRPLLLSSLSCRLLGCLPEKTGVPLKLAAAAAVILCALLVGGRWLWVGSATLGYLLRLALKAAEKHPAFSRKRTLVLLGLIAAVCIVMPLDEATQPRLIYSAESLACTLVMYILSFIPSAQRRLSTHPLPWLGRITMGLFVVHTPIYSLLGSSIYALLGLYAPKWIALSVNYLFAISLSILAAWLLHRAYDALHRKKT